MLEARTVDRCCKRIPSWGFGVTREIIESEIGIHRSQALSAVLPGETRASVSVEWVFGDKLGPVGLGLTGVP